jgi:hypothetical protein
MYAVLTLLALIVIPNDNPTLEAFLISQPAYYDVVIYYVIFPLVALVNV